MHLLQGSAEERELLHVSMQPSGGGARRQWRQPLPSLALVISAASRTPKYRRMHVKLAPVREAGQKREARSLAAPSAPTFATRRSRLLPQAEQ